MPSLIAPSPVISASYTVRLSSNTEERHGADQEKFEFLRGNQLKVSGLRFIHVSDHITSDGVRSRLCLFR